MEEAVVNEEKREKDPRSPEKIPEDYSTDNKKKDDESVNSHDKVIEIATPPVALTGSGCLGSGDNSIANSLDNAAKNVNHSVNNQAISVNMNYDVENQEIIDQEEEKSDPIDNADNEVSETGTLAMPSDTDNSNEQQDGDQDKPTEEKPKEHTSNNEEKSSEFNYMDMNDVGEQPEQKDRNQSDVVKEENLGNTEVPPDKAAEVTTTEILPSKQLVDEESPECKTEGDIATSTSNAEVVSSVDQTEMQKKEESACDKTKDIAESQPETTCDDEAGNKEKQPDSKVTTTEQCKDITDTPESCQLKTSWYVDDKEEGDLTPGAEGYSTTAGGVVVQKPFSSISSEPKKTAKVTTTGSVFKKMSWGSLFGRKKSTQDKPAVTAAVNETPVHDGTDGVQEDPPDDSDKKEGTTPVHTAEEIKDIGQEVKKSSEPLVEKTEKTEPEVPAKEEETKDIPEGAIVPFEEGVTEKDEKTAQVTDEVPQQDEQKNAVTDIEAPADEDSLLRERIIRRESASPAHSPTKHMHMRMSYAEGTKEVEVIGTREVFPDIEQDKQKSTKGNRLSCRALGEVDHEGWLTKRGGGAIFASWKRKWVVLKEQQLYYYKTSFDPEAGGVVPLKDLVVAAAPEMKKRFCFKIQTQDPKSSKLYLAADNQDDMDRWIDVLSCASRGEIIVRKSQNQQADNTKMRKKTNSLIGKRAGSVLGLGGYYEYDGDLEKTGQKRRASFGSSPKETQKNIQPVDKSETKDRCEPLSEDVTPGDIQKLMTIQAKGDDVDASVTMETSATTPLKEVPCSPEVMTNVATGASEIVSDEHTTTSSIKTEIKTSSSEKENEKSQPEVTPLEQEGTKEEIISTHEVMQSKESMEEAKDVHVGTPSKQSQKSQQLTLRTNTTWYYFLDTDNDDWLDLDAQKADSDELLSLVRSIKDARVSIMGTPLPGNMERARVLTTVSKENSEILKLKEMKRTLKDKERDLLAIEELFSKDVNHQSIHEWTTRYSHLTPEGENETIHENNSSTNGSKKEDNVGVQDGGVSEDKLDDGEGALEVKAAGNSKLEHDGGESGGESPDRRLEDGGEVQDYKPDDNERDQIDEETRGKKTENNGEMAQDGESQDGKTEDDVELQHEQQAQGSEDITTKEEVDYKTNEVVMEPDKGMAKPDAEDKGEELTTQVSQEQVTTEHNNNEEHTEKAIEKEDVNMKEKSVTTTDTVPAVQDHESLNTRL